MRRYATAPLSTFEDLFDRARVGPVGVETAEYPPFCAVRSGEVSFALGRTGAMIMHVRPGGCSSSAFRLRLLFETGACVFSSPRDLGHFCTGLLAAAFGIEPGEPIAAPRSDGRGHVDEQPNDPHSLEPGRSTRDLIADLGSSATAAGASPAEDDHLPSRRARPLTTATLSAELARVVHGQDPALERVASTVAAQLTKRHPSRPGSVILIGQTGVGKTATIEAIPTALRALGVTNAHVFRIDCGELTDSIQLTRLLGSPPGYSGYAETTPLIAAVEQPRCILLVDELEKAHEDVLDLLLGVLDAGRLTTPAGRMVDARHAVVALTTSISSSRLTETLERVPLEDRWAVQRACTEHLRSSGIPGDLVARIGAFAFYPEVVEQDTRTEVARAAVAALGSEYGLVVRAVDPVVLAVIEDIAADGGGAGARALHHAARELLAERFADLAGDGAHVHVAIEAGPPVAVRAATPARQTP